MSSAGHWRSACSVPKLSAPTVSPATTSGNVTCGWMPGWRTPPDEA